MGLSSKTSLGAAGTDLRANAQGVEWQAMQLYYYYLMSSVIILILRLVAEIIARLFSRRVS